MADGYWRTHAKEAIREAVLDWCDHRGHRPDTLKGMPPAEKQKLLKMIGHYYPFGERRHFPYKAWLQEVRVFRDWLDPKELPLEGLFAASTPREGM